MKKLFYLLIVVIFSLVIINQHNDIKTLNSKINALDYRIDNVNKKEIKTAQNDYKENFYLTQLNNSTTLILSVIGFSLVFAGFFSFKLFDDKVKSIDKSIESKINSVNKSVIDFIKTIDGKTKKYEDDYKKIEHTIYDLKNDLDYEIVNLKYNEAKEAFSRKNLSGYIFYSLYSCKYSVECIKYYRKTNSSLADSMLETMNSRIDNIRLDLESLLKYNKTDKHILPKNDKESIINFIHQINEIKNQNTFTLLNSIFNTLEFID